MGITGTWEGYVSNPLYLFNNGTWGGLQTTGITYFFFDNDRVADVGRAYISNNQIRFEASPNGDNNGNVTVYARFNQLINLTNYKYIKFNVSSINPAQNLNIYYLTLGYSNMAQANTNTSYSSDYIVLIGKVQIKTTGIGILDISTISGSYYIYILCDFYMSYRYPSALSYANVSQIFLSMS